MIGSLRTECRSRRIHRASTRSRSVAKSVVALLEFGVDAARLSELVFENDDPTRSLERGDGGDEFVRAGGDGQLVTQVAAVPPARSVSG
jgi:hypothetical protein